MFSAGKFSHGEVVDTRAMFAVYGIENNGMTLPKDTTEYNAVQSFEPAPGSQIPPTAELIGSVDIFGADIECESANMAFVNATNYWLNDASTTVLEYQNISVSSPSCEVYYPGFNVTDFYGVVGRADYRGIMEIVNCKNRSAGEESKRLLMAVTYIKEVENTQSMINATALLCIPSYEITHGKVAMNGSAVVDYGMRVLSARDSKPRILSGLSIWDLTSGLIKSALMAHGLVDPNLNITLGTFLGMAASQSNGDMPKFMVARVMKEQTRHLFRLITTQMAAQYLTVPIREEIGGTYNYYGSLLVPRGGPLIAMQGLLAVLVVTTIALIITVPRNVLPRSAESIGGLATILARSTKALKPLRGLGHVSSKTLQVILQAAFYRTSMSPQARGLTFRIERDEKPSDMRKSIHTRRKPVGFSPGNWWRPTSFSFPMMIVTLASPLVLVMALEITLRESSKANGLADVRPSSTDRFAWVFIPTIVLVFVATLFNLLDFDVASIQPYQALKKGNGVARKSVTQVPLRHTAIFRLYSGLLGGYLPAVATALAIIVAPMLTIVVSSLLLFRQVPYSGSVHVMQATWFNTTPNPEYLPADAANSLNLIVHGNLTYPKWTYDELVFPNITIQSLTESYTGNYFDQAQYLNVVLPAIRGRFNCTPWPITHIHRAKINMGRDFNGSDIGTLNDTEVGRVVVDGSQLLLTLPEELFGNIALADKQTSHYQFSFENVTSRGGSGYSAYETLTPGLIFYGHFKENVLDNFTITSCNPFVELVNVNVTLTLPDYVISTAQPPIVFEDTARFFAPVPPLGNPDFSTLDTDFQVLNATDGNAFTPFFQAMVYGRDGVPAQELMNQSRLIEASEHLYRVYKAQTMNAYYRIPAATDTEALNATYLFEQRMRLQQNTLATRLLQCLLSVLLACGMVTYAVIWIDTKGTMRVVPRNPHSIASVACLLVESEILSEKVIPPGAEWWSDKEMKKNGLFDGWTFSLGWWRDGKGDSSNESRFGIDVGKAQERADTEATR
jgi:Protein of unknown function (DUF3433)